MTTSIQLGPAYNTKALATTELRRILKRAPQHRRGLKIVKKTVWVIMGAELLPTHGRSIKV